MGFRVTLFLIGFAATTANAASPVLRSLEPGQGAPRALVSISGERLDAGRIVWDVGLASAKELAGPYRGAYFFSVPVDASSGPHPIGIKNQDGTSTPVDFVVSGVTSKWKPRIDDISLVNTIFDSARTVAVVLYVQGANIDAGADVLVDGAVIPSQAHKVLINDLHGASPSALGYSIDHFLSRVAVLGSRPRGSTIKVVVRNSDGEMSSPHSFSLPKDEVSLDSDGDSIPDLVELHGYDNGKGLVDLTAMGANPYRKDVFVEMDVMEGVRNPPIAQSGAQLGTFDLAREMYADAPLLNPFGPDGINLYIDGTGTVPNWALLEFSPANNVQTQTASFDVLRDQNFTSARRGLFHYAIWARAYSLKWSGKSNVDFDGTGVGDGFFVSLAEFPASAQTLASQAETVAHELGHDLGQRHGGTDHSQHKPNYWSVMSYAWQIRTAQGDSFRMKYPTCTQIYYGLAGAVEPVGKLPSPDMVAIDYSSGMGPSLNGKNGSLNEQTGVCGQAIDWDHDGRISNTGVRGNLDPDDLSVGTTEDYPNWPNLKFFGPAVGVHK